MAYVANHYGRNTSSVYRRKAAELKASEAGRICVICGQEIDRSISAEDYNSPAYWTVEHSPALSKGGRLIEDIVGAAHRGCNSSEGGKMAHPPSFNPADIEVSRAW